MGVVYVLNSSDYSPISIGDKYLYQEYDKVASFLKRNFESSIHSILAKPVLANGAIQWHAEVDVPLTRIGDLSADIQVRIKKRYWKIKEELEKEVYILENSNNAEKKKWGSILRQIFDDENNVLLTDGDFWCLMWGWKFKNKKENYLPPEFLADPVPAPAPEPLVEEPQQEEEVIPLPQEPVQELYPKRKSSFWYGLKRLLRNFVYRFWGLLMLILLVLFLWCLFQKCTREECAEVDALNKELDALNAQINDRCPETAQ